MMMTMMMMMMIIIIIIIIPVPTPVHSSPKGECGLLSEHNEHHMKRRCNRLRGLASIFLPAALCL